MNNKKIISVVAVVLAVCLIGVVAFVVKNNGAVERNVEEGKNNTLLTSNSEKDSEKKDIETSQEDKTGNEETESDNKENVSSSDTKVDTNIDKDKSEEADKGEEVEENNTSGNEVENNSGEVATEDSSTEEGTTEGIGTEEGATEEGTTEGTGTEEGITEGNDDEGQEGEEGDMRDRLGLNIGRIINSNKITIDGETFKGESRGTIVTHAYNEDFRKVAGNYLIKTQEEYLQFLGLMMDKSLSENTELANVDFEKYAIVIKAIESNSGAYSYEVNGVIIGENGMDIDLTVSGSGMTCDMARFYPYVVIEKEKLTNDTYEGWKNPLDVESVYPSM